MWANTSKANIHKLQLVRGNDESLSCSYEQVEIVLAVSLSPLKPVLCHGEPLTYLVFNFFFLIQGELDERLYGLLQMVFGQLAVQCNSQLGDETNKQSNQEIKVQLMHLSI